MSSIAQTLYFDPQCQLDMKKCPVCGCNVYGPTYRCIRCERESA